MTLQLPDRSPDSIILAGSKWALIIGFAAIYILLAAVSLAELPSPDLAWIARAVVLATLLIVLSVEDAMTFRLPDSFTALLLGSGLLTAAIEGKESFLVSAFSALIGFAALWLTAFAYRSIRNWDGLGFGDIKLLGAAGAWVGVWALPTLILAATSIALIASLIVLIRGRKLSGTSVLPFGPFLAVATWIVWLFGHL